MAQLPEPLGLVRKEALDSLAARLVAMFDGADDALFDLSQKAPEAEQSTYFDAMRELRVKREQVQQGFIDELGTAFDDMVASTPGARAGAVIDLASLALVDDEQLEVSVAFQGMARRCSDMLATDIDHLAQRIGKVLRRDPEPDRLGLHPRAVCEAFRKAMDPVPLPLKARLILYKLFQRTVLDVLQDIIAQANQTLIGAGILPEIKSTKPRPLPSPTRERPRPEAAGTGAGSGTGGSDSGFSEAVSELLALTRAAIAGRNAPVLPPGMTAIPLAALGPAQIPVMQGGKAMVGGVPVQSDQPIQVIAQADLNDLLSRLQALEKAAAAAGEGEGNVDVKIGLSGLMQEAPDKPRALNQADDDVINLVSMLFDFILDDAEVPAEMKALLGRLQIPLLKVAIIDKTFFNSADHPARLLLNALAKVSVGWTPETDDGLRKRIESVVYAVLNEFADDPGLFRRLLDDFAAFVFERERRTSVVDARLRDREEGQARAEQAQAMVREAIGSRLSGRELAPEVVTLVQDAWQRVLYMTATREGTDNEVWQQRLKVLEVLVWCAQRHEGADARTRQRALVPRLLVSLRKGMEAVGYDAARGEQLIEACSTVFAALADGGARTVKVVQEQAPAAPAGTTAPASAVTEVMQVLRSSDSEIVIAAPPPPPPPPPPAEENWRRLADSLAPGAWVEFSDNDFRVRGRIAARLKVQDRFVFVNGRGVKLCEKSTDQLAADFAAGVARLVSEAALFDRALENMIGRLRADPGAAAR